MIYYLAKLLTSKVVAIMYIINFYKSLFAVHIIGLTLSYFLFNIMIATANPNMHQTETFITSKVLTSKAPIAKEERIIFAIESSRSIV